MDEHVREQFFNAIMRIKKTEAAFSSECEIQMNELAILQSIAAECEQGEQQGVNLNMPDILERLQISKPAVSYILNTLEKKSYIKREIDPKDRRKISITATPEGLDALRQFSSKRNEMWDMLVEQFGEGDMQLLIALVTRLTDIFERLHKEAKGIE